MEARFRGPQRDPHRCGGVRERQAEVVVKDDHGAVFRLEMADATLDQVAVGRGRLGVRHRERMDLGELDLDASALGRPELIAAGVEEEPVEPRLEAIGVAQAGQVPPAPDERLLDGVLRAVGIPEDESGRGVQSTDRGACQQGEGVMIALPRPLHEVSLHVALVSARPVWSRLESIGGFVRQNRSVFRVRRSTVAPGPLAATGAAGRAMRIRTSVIAMRIRLRGRRRVNALTFGPAPPISVPELNPKGAIGIPGVIGQAVFCWVGSETASISLARGEDLANRSRGRRQTGRRSRRAWQSRCSRC